MDKACEAFLSVAENFKLGTLETEKPHPLTVGLSHDSQTNIQAAIASLKAVDRAALQKFEAYLPDLLPMGRDIRATLATGGRIYLCGCGATGRLSISLEVFCRQGLVEDKYQDRFIGFMAGGDAALIKSIENFEDFPEFGERQLLELGYGPNDLLISTTEGGETPFVIGATEAAVKYGTRKPWFLYCNPEAQLAREVARSRDVIENSGIRSLSLYVGEMALSGSTRMQASTVLMAAVGWAFNCDEDATRIQARLSTLSTVWQQLDLSGLANFITSEADCYLNEEYVLYESETYGVTVLTDTTERSPTFSLPPFENESNPTDPVAWCYLVVPSAPDSSSAWESILKRSPRCLSWNEFESFTGETYLYGFHIDQSCETKRDAKTRQSKHHTFKIESTDEGFLLSFQEHELRVNTSGLSAFEENLVLKMILNIHSTLVMGILKRFESNLMTYVKPTNFKLIDRTIRYVQRLSELSNQPKVEYEEIAGLLFKLKDTLSPEEPIVLRLLEALPHGE